MPAPLMVLNLAQLSCMLMPDLRRQAGLQPNICASQLTRSIHYSPNTRCLPSNAQP